MALKVGVRTAAGELPRFEELDPLRFQSMCRAIYQEESHIATCDVYGVSGQPQQGIDLRAFHKAGASLDVAQCKCIEPKELTAALLREVEEEFFKYLEHWKAQGVRKFVLMVAPSTAPMKIQKEYENQRAIFSAEGIEYELWGQEHISGRLGPHPGIVSTYLEDPWRDRLCGSGLSGFPGSGQGSAVDRILTGQLEVLAGHVSDSGQIELVALREAWREGRKGDVVLGLDRLKETTRWLAFPPQLQASILRFSAQLALEEGDVPRARALSADAALLDPDANGRLAALLARADGDLPAAVSVLEHSAEPESRTLHAALLMEGGAVKQALDLLRSVDDSAEVHRLRGLGFALQGDLALARIECNKAVELAPLWQSTRFTRGIVSYLSGLSPAVLPRAVPGWPEPENWTFVKTDDESRRSFGLAADDFEFVERRSDGPGEPRQVCQAWRLASLANVPDFRDRATDYCRLALESDPTNYRLVVWALARRLSVDLAAAIGTLDGRIAARIASASEVATRVALHFHNGRQEHAVSLLKESQSLFSADGSEWLWHLWAAQVGLSESEAVNTDAPSAPSDSPIELQLARARADTRRSGDEEAHIRSLRQVASLGNGRALVELTLVLASMGRWTDAAAPARLLPELVGTADVVCLAATVLYNATSHSDALEVLDSKRDVFPQARLPEEMRRLRMLLQRSLGMLQPAIAEAEEAFRTAPSKETFLLLATLYFEKGDFGSLAILARRHVAFEDLTSTELLQLSFRVNAEDRPIAAEVWRRAVALGVLDDDLGIAVDLGFRLGLDRELRPTLQRLYESSGGSRHGVRRIGFEEAVSLMLARRGDVERIISTYRSGLIPVHLAAVGCGVSLATWFHRLFEANESSGRKAKEAVYVRHGSRSGAATSWADQPTVHLHADLTALLLAQHFSMLDSIESHFKTIALPRRTPLALAEMRESLRPNQPSRVTAATVVHDSWSRGRIQLFGRGGVPFLGSFDDAVSEVASTGRLFVDSPSSGDVVDIGVDQPMTAREGHRTGHALVRSLENLAEITAEQRLDALEFLGPERMSDSEALVGRNSELLCRCSMLEVLASAGLLGRVTEVFHVRVVKDDFDQVVAGPVAAARDAQESADWVAGLLDRIQRGIESGLYQLLPEIAHDHESGLISTESPTLLCLFDLLKFEPSEGAVVWSDDRWVTSNSHRDGMPVVGTPDLVRHLWESHVISDSEWIRFNNRLRECGGMFCSVEAAEVTALVSQAPVVDGVLKETRELITLRRGYATALANGDVLQVDSDNTALTLEWPFLLSSSAAVFQAMAECFLGGIDIEQARARAEWVTRQLYCPDKGRALTVATRVGELDLRLEAMALSGLVFRAMVLPVEDASGRRIRRECLEWFHSRLLVRRFDADRKLAEECLRTLRTTLWQLIETVAEGNEDRQMAAKLAVTEFIADMPDELASRLTDDIDFLGRIGASRTQFVSVGPHRVTATELWRAGTEALKTGLAVELVVRGRSLTVLVLNEQGRASLGIDDHQEHKRYVLADGLDLLSESPAVRERAVRDLSEYLDLPRGEEDEQVARISSLDDAASRMTEMTRLRNNSVENSYRELSRKLSSGEPVNISLVRAESPELVLRNLRLDADGPDAFQVRLDRAAEVLLREKGILETAIRLAGLPVRLPEPLCAAIAALELSERHVLVRNLFHSIRRSPLGAIHLVRICSSHPLEFPTYRRHLRRWIRHWQTPSSRVHWAAWHNVLKGAAAEFSGSDTFRALPDAIKLCAIWSHGDRLFRVMANAGVEDNWLNERYGSWILRLPDEITLGVDGYTADVVHPTNTSAIEVVLAGLGDSDPGSPVVVEEDISRIHDELESDPASLVRLMKDVSASPNATGSFLAVQGIAGWWPILAQPISDRFSQSSLRGQVALALDQIASSGADPAAWVALSAITQKGSVAPEFRERLGVALLATDLTSLNDPDERFVGVAALTACQLASACGEPWVQHLRTQVISLVRSLSNSGESEGRKKLGADLLSAPFHLFGRQPTNERFLSIARLLEEMVVAWPSGLADACQVVVDRLIESLPNEEARWFWALQIRVRALR